VRHADHDLVAFLLTPYGVERRHKGPIGVYLQHLEPILMALDADVHIRSRQEFRQCDLSRVLLAGEERTNDFASRVFDELTLADVHATHSDILLITCFSDNR